MKFIEVENRNKAISRARKRVVTNYGDENRKWLIGKAPDCYGNPRYPTEIHVLEGSPARGFVLVTEGSAIAISLVGESLAAYDFPPEV